MAFSSSLPRRARTDLFRHFDVLGAEYHRLSERAPQVGWGANPKKMQSWK
jgi:hypothetical protein